MASFSGLGIGLSFVFGCIFLGLVAELFYILCWKKRIMKRRVEDQYTSIARDVSNIFCWKKREIRKTNIVHQEGQNAETTIESNQEDLEANVSKDVLLKGFGEEGVESELMRLHNLCGPPRFLFTIKEETKEDLESIDRSRKGSRTRSLSDIIVGIDTPFLTPLSSPPIKGNYNYSLDCYNHHGFNPLFESMSEAELQRVRSSPPPKFKFLRDAEEKLMRRLMVEAEKRVLRNGGNLQDFDVKSCSDSSVLVEAEKRILKNGGNLQDFDVKSCSNPSVVVEEIEGSFLSFINKSKERKEMNNQMLPLYHSTPSQVIPLASSPSTFSGQKTHPM